MANALTCRPCVPPTTILMRGRAEAGGDRDDHRRSNCPRAADKDRSARWQLPASASMADAGREAARHARCVTTSPDALFERHGQVTSGFQSANMPSGLCFQTHACSTYQLSTGFRMCSDSPNTDGGLVFPVPSQSGLGNDPLDGAKHEGPVVSRGDRRGLPDHLEQSTDHPSSSS